MKLQHIIGADLSKRTIDLVCQSTGSYFQIENSPAGFKQIRSWLNNQKVDVSSTLIVMEHTGLYSSRLEEFLFSQRIAFTKISALEIKRSAGLTRGKSDKVDAARIAEYGWEKKHKLSVNTQVSKELKRLAMLHSSRERLVRHRASLIRAVKEYRHLGLAKKDLIIKSEMVVIKSFDKQIDLLEAEIQTIIKSDECLLHNFKLLQTIKGVGKVLAVAMIIKTNNFTRFLSSRKFACFCGTAPFEHSSGTSIRKKTRVSHLADKSMKSLLDLSAKSAIQFDKELRSYYLRRLEMGKSKMSTINIVRNKIIYRMFAVIKRQTPFIENYLEALKEKNLAVPVS